MGLIIIGAVLFYWFVLRNVEHFAEDEFLTFNPKYDIMYGQKTELANYVMREVFNALYYGRNAEYYNVKDDSSILNKYTYLVLKELEKYKKDDRQKYAHDVCTSILVTNY